MSNRYGISFLIIGLILGECGVLDSLRLGAWSFFLLYPAATFILLAFVYLGMGPALLGKRSNGKIASFGWICFGPYFLLNHLVMRLLLMRSREPAIGQALPNLWFGRRLSLDDQSFAESLSLHACVDLTAELPEANFLRGLPHYRCFPILDGTAPSTVQLREIVAWILTMTGAGPVYVHCALGHGRTGTILIAYLMATSRAADIHAALELLRHTRPGVAINRQQREVLQQFVLEGSLPVT